jgi:hypothetical protein
MTFRSVAKDDAYQPASRDIMIGCVRTMAVSQKKVRTGTESVHMHVLFPIILTVQYNETV